MSRTQPCVVGSMFHFLNSLSAHPSCAVKLPFFSRDNGLTIELNISIQWMDGVVIWLRNGTLVGVFLTCGLLVIADYWGGMRVILSEAKDLVRRLPRSFASLRMTIVSLSTTCASQRRSVGLYAER